MNTFWVLIDANIMVGYGANHRSLMGSLRKLSCVLIVQIQLFVPGQLYVIGDVCLLEKK